MEKVVFFAFKGELLCFAHVLINALDMADQNMEAKIVMEGEAVKLLKELEESGNELYKQAKDRGLFDSICKACSAKMGVLEYNETTGIPISGEIKGHPSMSRYIKEGYRVITM
ncbi:DsrE family protein [Isachenkonia alkalipeptolytica]|uniref:Cytoplasmic protein n=1 Tax=Isachenkonia alkalipeptolytica TaxID=2565777 RepID=A0AA43XK32_9CLOT|nr:DsrE family protein [Isachenkonia alkalipeptolytica]NBG88345.1 cytoplasmic protein [Isachenkonia alkalipeptolytica]